jgi:8-oxo-dGTP diphosphatase
VGGDVVEGGVGPDADVAARRVGGALAVAIQPGRTTAQQQDVVCGEGAAMLFVPAGEAAGLPFGATYTRIVPEFLASPQYRRLAGASATG